MGVRKIVSTDWLAQVRGDYRLQQIWLLGIGGFLLHGILDPFLTYLAVDVYQVGTETNRWLGSYLTHSTSTFVAIHIPLLIVVIGVLYALSWLFSQASSKERQDLYRISVAGWGLIIIWGIIVVLNNSLIVVSGIGFS